MSSHFKGPLVAAHSAMGGAAMELGIGGLAGETNIITVFDDFNGVVPTEAFGAATNWETMGWVLTDVGVPANDEVGMNDPADVDQWNPSCIRIDTGDTEDTGGNMQLDRINASLPASGGHSFPHLCLPETAAGVAALDNTIITFACRVGLRADTDAVGSGAWDSKAFIGWSVAGEGAIMTPGTGVLAVAGAEDQLLGFHIPEAGAIDGIAQRVGTTAYAEGTNFTRMVAPGGVDGTVANGATTAGDTIWFDLALRAQVTDWSLLTGNGRVEFFWRRIDKRTDAPGAARQEFPPWIRHSTRLTNQIPSHTVGLVPTIEAINGPTADTDGQVFLDWWCFGLSRVSRQ